MDNDLGRRLYRTSPPTYPGGGVLGDGGQFEWVWAIPLPYRILADPRTPGAMPESPRRLVAGPGSTSPNVVQGVGYFACLQSLLTFSFGWTRHDRGLRRWYEHGQPTEDPRLALINAVWGGDGMLLRYAAWCTDSASGAPGEKWFGEPLHAFMSIPVDRSPMLDDADWSELVRVERSRAQADGLHASPWGMHLGGGDHIASPAGWEMAGGYPAQGWHGSSGRRRLLGADPSLRRATYVSDQVGGWYAGLATLGSELPTLPGDASWRIDVFVKPYGFLGTFRRSRLTGLWFAGRHRYHEMGN